MSDIQSLHRAFSILQLISEEPELARPSLIAEQIGLPRTTVLRMLATLENIGAVVRPPNSKTYSIGQTIQQIAQPKPSRQQLKLVARPHLQTLAHETGETVYLCVESRQQVYYVDQIDAQHHILLRNWVDTYFPLHATAAGKLFLAFWEEAKLEAHLKRPLTQFTPNTITQPDKIRSYIKAIRQAGVAWTHGQTEEGLVGVAAPIWGQNQLLVGAVSVGGPAFRFPRAGTEEKTAVSVIETARKISAQF